MLILEDYLVSRSSLIHLYIVVMGGDSPLEVKISPVTGLEWPRGFQEVEVPRFHDNGTQAGGKVVSLTHRPHLPLGKSPGTHFR